MNRCPHCHDHAYVNITGTDLVRPCRNCNPRAFERWARGDYLPTGILHHPPRDEPADNPSGALETARQTIDQLPPLEPQDVTPLTDQA